MKPEKVARMAAKKAVRDAVLDSISMGIVAQNKIIFNMSLSEFLLRYQFRQGALRFDFGVPLSVEIYCVDRFKE